MRVKMKPCSGKCNGELRPIWKREAGLGYCKNCWLSKNGVKPVTKRSPLPRTSDKRAKEERLYSVARKIFLQQNPICHVALIGYCTATTTDVHHMAGRGKYFLDQTKWLATCRGCHTWIELNPEEAKQYGWSLPRLTNE